MCDRTKKMDYGVIIEMAIKAPCPNKPQRKTPSHKIEIDTKPTLQICGKRKLPFQIDTTLSEIIAFSYTFSHISHMGTSIK
jgi:hypothetical protein